MDRIVNFHLSSLKPRTCESYCYLAIAIYLAAARRTCATIRSVCIKPGNGSRHVKKAVNSSTVGFPELIARLATPKCDGAILILWNVNPAIISDDRLKVQSHFQNGLIC